MEKYYKQDQQLLSTDGKWKNFLYRNEVPEAVLKNKFDYLDEEESSDMFFKWKGDYYHTSEFMRFNQFGPKPTDGISGEWDGYLGFSYSNGLVIKISKGFHANQPDEGEQYQIGYYYSLSEESYKQHLAEKQAKKKK